MNLHSAIFLLMVLACNLLPGQQRELPILEFPSDAPTRREFTRQVHEFNQSELQLYQEFSQDPPAVQALAIPFLESSIERFSGLASNEAADSNLWPELPDMGEKIVAAGSEDPIVLMHLADALRYDLQFEAARKAAEKAVNRFKDSKYPQGLHFLAIYRLYLTQFEGVWPGFRSLPGTRKKLLEASPAWLAYVDELPNGPRIGLSIYVSAADLDERLRFELEPVEAALKVYENVEAPDPWILEMLRARYYQDLAWRYRGGGFANEVERDGWQAFEKYMKLASAHARNAYSLNPQFPESSALLINIALAGHDDDTIFYWFERCIAAEIDHAGAYLNLLGALRPRWGGSYDAMLEFGEQCADTKRFDTDVPRYLLESCFKVVEDSGTMTWLEIFERPGLYELTRQTVNRMVDHRIRQLPRAADDDRRNENPQKELSEAQIALLTQLLGMAEHSQHFEDATLLWERLGKSASEHYLESFSLNPTYNKWRAHACLEFGEVMDKQIRPVLDTANQNLENAQRAHDRVTGWLAESENPHAQAYLRTWLQMTEMSIRYHEGEWVDLKFSTGLPEWFLQKGRWTVEDESTVLANNLTNLNTTQIYHRMRFPGDKEIQLELAKGDRPGGLLGGLAVGDYAGVKSGRLLFADLKRNELGFNTARTDPNSFKVKTMNPILLRTWNGGQYEVIAGAAKFIALTEDSGFDDAGGLVGLSSVYRVRVGGEMRFKNIRIRKLRLGPRPDFGNDPALIKYFTSRIVNGSEPS